MSDKVLIEVIATGKGLKVVAKDTEAVAKATEKVDKSQKQAAKSGNKYDKQNKAIYQGNLSASKGFSKLNETIGSGGSSGLVAAYATLAANVFAATAAFNALRRASQVEQLVQGLEALGQSAGKNLTLLSEKIKEAAGDAIALDQALRVASVGASASFSSAQLEGLTEVARSAAIALGRDVGDAIDRLARGAAKLEPEILDELGIFVRLDDASAKYAARLGKSVSELTRFEQRQAFANEIIDQGRQKFALIGEAVDVSPFDKLAATLGDLARGFTDFFNRVLGPLASFLADNTLALAGLFAVLTKGIVSQALPFLNTFAQKAQAVAADALGLASAQVAKTDKEIKAQRALLKPLNVVKGEYGKLFGKIKQGTATTQELELANKKLQSTILTRQRNIEKGQLKNIQKKKEELALIQEEQRQIQKLINLEKQRAGQAGGAAAARSQGQFANISAGVLGSFDKDIAEGNFLKGMQKAFNRSNKATGAYISRVKKAGIETKIFGKSVPFLSKNLAIGGAAFRGFGLTAKVAIKGIFTAIPVIGQLLLVVDLLIVGIKKAIGFLAGFGGEASRLEKANKRLGDQLAFVAENQTKQAQASRTAAQQIVTAGNATRTLIEVTKEQSAAQEESAKKAGAFGKLLLGLQKRAQYVGRIIGTLFTDAGFIFDKLVIQLQKGIVNLTKAFSFLLNPIIRIINFLNQGSGIPPIEEITTEGANKKLKELNSELKVLEDLRERQLGASAISIFGVAAGTSSELDSFVATLNSTGAAADELNRFLGTNNINEFAAAIQQANSSQTLEGFSSGIKQIIEDFKFFDDKILTSIELQELLGIALERGTDQTQLEQAAIEELGQTFQNSNEKIAEFFNTFNKKTNFSNFRAILKDINQQAQTIANIPGLSDSAFIQIVEATSGTGGGALSGTFKEFLNNNKELLSINKKINETFEIYEKNNIAITQEQKEQIKNNLGLGQGYRNAIKEALLLVDAIVRAQFYDKARLQVLKQQEDAVKKTTSANEAATKAQIALSNQQVGINISRFQNEIKFQEQTLGLTEGQVLSTQEILKLSDEQQGKYATLLEARANLSSETEKQISAEEELALLAQAKNALALKEFELTKQLRIESEARIKSEQIFANLSKGKGGQLSPAQTLELEKTAAANKILNLNKELELLDAKLNFEILITEARLKAAGVEGATITLITQGLEKQAQIQKDILNSKIEIAKIEEKNIGASNFTGLQSGGVFSDINNAFDLAVSESSTKAGEGIQAQLEIMMDATAPIREQLEALGPEGELISQAQQGMLTIASSFDVIKDKGLASAEGMAAVGNAITAMSAIMQANSKAQVAELDKQIEAEKKRDGKSAESVAKIKAMEAKKEAIQRKAFEQKKKMDIASAIISTALGVTRALELGPIIGPILAVMQAAMGMAQIALIKKQTFQGGSGGVEEPRRSTIDLGKRSNRVDVSRAASAGEASYLRGGAGVGSNANNFVGASMGRRGYADGGEGVVVGERGPEVIAPSSPIDVIPNYALGGQAQNITFNINAVDGQSVQNMLMDQQGTIIGVIRNAANSYGEDFLPEVNVGYDLGGG